MKKNKLLFVAIFLASVLFQIMHFQNHDNFYRFGFAIGLDNNAVGTDIALNLVYVIAPILFIVFYSSGSVYDMTDGYGKLLIIRHYSKTKLYLKMCLKNLIISIAATAIQSVIYLCFNYGFPDVGMRAVKSLCMYAFILNAILNLQGILELIAPPHIVNIIVFIFCFLSYYVVQNLPLYTDIMWIEMIVKVILFPALLFGMQNGAVHNGSLYTIFLLVTLVLNFSAISIGIHRFKKTDIF